MTGTRICRYCTRPLPLTAFHRAGTSRDGSARYRVECRECRRFLDSVKYDQRREAHGAVKTCAGCRQNKPVTDFYARRDGQRRAHCKVCQVAEQQRRLRAKRQNPAERERLATMHRVYCRRHALKRALGKAART